MVNAKFKRLLCEICQNTCEICHKEFSVSELVIHRIRRGNTGGLYEHRNCQVLCTSCHKLIHGNEFT